MTEHKLPVSIIICTYNRSELLSAAIESLFIQTVPPDRYEIVVVDNFSTDATRNVVLQIKKNSPVQISYVFEEKQGLGISRTTGYLAARGEYIGFIDDDAKAPEDFIEKAIEIIEKFNCQVYSFGGKIIPYYLAPKPDWFWDRYETRTWGDNPRWLKKNEALSGSNMFFRKDIYEQIHFGTEALGMIGEKMGFGEDKALFENLFRLFHDRKDLAYYTPCLFVYHAVPSYKMTVKYRLKRYFSNGQVSFQRKRPIGRMEVFRYGIRQLLITVWLTCKAVFSIFKHSRWQQWVLECWGPVVKRLGMVRAWLASPIEFHSRTKSE